MTYVSDRAFGEKAHRLPGCTCSDQQIDLVGCDCEDERAAAAADTSTRRHQMKRYRVVYQAPKIGRKVYSFSNLDAARRRFATLKGNHSILNVSLVDVAPEATLDNWTAYERAARMRTRPRRQE